MAFTQSNLARTVMGNKVAYSGLFTSASGDNTLTITHGMYNPIVTEAILQLVGAQVPKMTTSAGATTFVWDDTQGASGQFLILGN